MANVYICVWWMMTQKAELPSWVLLDDVEAPKAVVSMVISLVDVEWTKQNVRTLKFNTRNKN